MSIKHKKSLEYSYDLGREICGEYMKDPDLVNISLESIIGILTANWYINTLYYVLNIYAPVMKKYVATSEKNVEDIIPRSKEWLENYQNGIRDEWKLIKSSKS